MSQNIPAPAMAVALKKNYQNVNQKLIASDNHLISNSISSYTGANDTFYCEGAAC